jgi:hypothetical protein
LKNKFIAAATIYSNFGTALKNNPLEIKKNFKLKINIICLHISLQDTLQLKKEKIISDLELKLKKRRKPTHKR